MQTLAPYPKCCLSPTLFGLSRVTCSPISSPTSAVAVVIFVPPEAPTTILTLFVLSTKMEGHIEDIGCLPVEVRDAREAQLSTCSLQTASSCPHVWTQSLSIHLPDSAHVSCQPLEIPLSPVPISFMCLWCKLSPGSSHRGWRYLSSQSCPSWACLWCSCLQYTMACSFLSFHFPCPSPKHRLAESQPALVTIIWVCRKQ